MSKVVVLKCESYDQELVYEKISWALEQLGGIESIIPKEKTVLLKPNLVVGSAPELAVTTHPSILNGIGRILHEKNYNILYGDSPGLGNPYKAAQKSGLVEVAERYNMKFADFSNGKQISVPESNVCKQFNIVNAYFEADAIINLPKMKAHALQRITGAIKNPFGMVLGYNKATMHSRYTNAFIFAEMLVDLNNYLKVDLHIMDGIVAMEGNGPKNGTPVNMNVILVSTDPVALDSVFCKLVDVNPDIIPAITYGEKYGLGSNSNIELIGDDLEPLINKTFDIPKNKLKIEDVNKFAILKKVVRRPYIEDDLCKKCGVCVEVCPLEEKAVNWHNGDKSKPPVYDYTKCIRCYCCQEMCPHNAIEVDTPLLGKILYKVGILK
jgi:uncharacterized protein (DUF362 family)/NAD-dependent dihydropyrimidine dehydrogenase PreA subunit